MAVREPTIRPAEIADREAFIAMALRSWFDAYTALLPQAEIADAPAMMARAWEKRWTEFRVADLNGALAGFYSLGDVQDLADVNYLWHLYVDPGWQRRGIGRALNRAALTEIASRGARSAWLDVLEGNAKARAFYTALGWQETGRDPEDPMLVLMEVDTAGNR